MRRALIAAGMALGALSLSACQDRASPGGAGTPGPIAAEPARSASTAVSGLAPSAGDIPTSQAGAPSPVPAGGAPLLRRPWLSLTKGDLEEAAKKAGYQLDGSSESDGESGRLLRIVKVSRGSFRGSVAWYKTDDVEGARSSLVKGAPHRVEGGVLIAVKPLDPGGQAEAEALLRALLGP